MGATQSVQELEDGDESEGEEEEEEEEEDSRNHEQSHIRQLESSNLLVKKVLEQEPEVLPCHASASPLSPQLSAMGTPRLGPSIKVWDPYNVLAPPPPLPPPPVFARSFSMEDDRSSIEVYLINHGECDLNLRPDLVGGRCDGVLLTGNGKRQARALAVFLNSQGVRFSAVYCSPLDRARSMAISVCQEMNFAEEQIQSSDALIEMSMGHWEGCLRSETYTPEVLTLVEKYQPDFSAPSGESLRQVEFRMVQFLNNTLLGLPDKLRAEFFSQHRNGNDREGSSLLPAPNWDTFSRNRPVLSKKKSGKSRLQFVSNTGDHDADDEMSPRETHLLGLNVRNTSSSSSSSSMHSPIGIFTHSLPIKCLVTGLLGCSPAMSHRICVDDSSVTVLQHSWKTGWQVKRLNDTAHLRLL